MIRVGVLDYGSGNTHSACRALEYAGAQVVFSSQTRELAACEALVVPGVGAFAACVEQLRASGLDRFITDQAQAGTRMLGICVGHQIFFEHGDEHGEIAPGLGLMSGSVTRLTSQRLPHMGWNTVHFPEDFFGHLTGERFYFVHSYAAHQAPEGAAVAWCTHEGDRFVAAVRQGSITSTQFHPEKSQESGQRFLRSWLMS